VLGATFVGVGLPLCIVVSEVGSVDTQRLVIDIIRVGLAAALLAYTYRGVPVARWLAAFALVLAGVEALWNVTALSVLIGLAYVSMAATLTYPPSVKLYFRRKQALAANGRTDERR